MVLTHPKLVWPAAVPETNSPEWSCCDMGMQIINYFSLRDMYHVHVAMLSLASVLRD